MVRQIRGAGMSGERLVEVVVKPVKAPGQFWINDFPACVAEVQRFEDFAEDAGYLVGPDARYLVPRYVIEHYLKVKSQYGTLLWIEALASARVIPRKGLGIDGTINAVLDRFEVQPPKKKPVK